jgi:hypothetical protein
MLWAQQRLRAYMAGTLSAVKSAALAGAMDGARCFLLSGNITMVTERNHPKTVLPVVMFAVGKNQQEKCLKHNNITIKAIFQSLKGT